WGRRKGKEEKRKRAEKKATRKKSAAPAAKKNAAIAKIVQKMMRKAAPPADLAELGHAIYQTPGHVIDLPGIPPDKALGRRFKTRVDDRLLTYILVAGEIDDKWVLYSVLVKNQ